MYQQAPYSDWLSTIMWIVLLTIFAYISREIEILRITREIENYMSLYKYIRDKAVRTVVNFFKEVAAKKGTKLDIRLLEHRVYNLIESVTIEPEDKDPFGIMNKIKHILLTHDETLTKEINFILPKADKVDVENLKDLLMAAHELNYIYKAVDHIYRQARKFKSLWLLMQLQAQLPFLSEYVKALENSLEAFSNGFPIGDSAGPLVAASFIKRHCTDETEIEDIAEDTILVEVPFKGRRVFVIKAKGPSGVTGRLDDAIERLITRRGIKPAMIITVDAATKYEGEKSGMIVDGVGVAIGGIGVEKFNIEHIATKYNIALYAVLIKMSMSEALSVMSKEVADSIEKAVKRVEDIILERTKEGDSIILVGVGNTIGVSP